MIYVDVDGHVDIFMLQVYGAVTVRRRGCWAAGSYSYFGRDTDKAAHVGSYDALHS